MTATNNWQRFYNNVKDPSWPVCDDISDFYQLPQSIQNEILTEHSCEFADLFFKIEFIDYAPLDKSSNDKLADFIPPLELQFSAGDITVYYDSFLDGGGTGFGQNFSRVIKTRYPDRIFNQAIEWCSGPGFIGFRLLADGLCNSIWFSDIYKPAIYAVNQTIHSLPAKYHGRATALNIGNIADMPEDLVFDLVVANPPMFDHLTFAVTTPNCIGRIGCDPNWDIHRNFFQHISKHLSKDGVILLVEHAWGSSPNDFKEMIYENGLKIIKSYGIKNVVDFWYLEITHQ